MPQLYLLSVIANLVAGLTLAGDTVGARFGFLSGFKDLQAHRGAVVSIGLVAAVVGALKLLVGSPGETVPVAGDLLPAVAGVAMGLMLVADKLRHGSGATESGQEVAKMAGSLLAYRVPVGVAGVVIALAHFLFPAAVIL